MAMCDTAPSVNERGVPPNVIGIRISDAFDISTWHMLTLCVFYVEHMCMNTQKVGCTIHKILTYLCPLVLISPTFTLNVS